MMIFPAPVKMMAIQRTWIKISMMIVLMTATLTGQMEKVKGMEYDLLRMRSGGIRAETLRAEEQV